jgi:hypothetical protein
MNRSQRIILAFYCLLLVYCSVWIPWQVPARHFADGFIHPAENLGYGWLWDVLDSQATPDLHRILLRFVAATAMAAAFFFLAGLWKSARHY